MKKNIIILLFLWLSGVHKDNMFEPRFVSDKKGLEQWVKNKQKKPTTTHNGIVGERERLFWRRKKEGRNRKKKGTREIGTRSLLLIFVTVYCCWCCWRGFVSPWRDSCSDQEQFSSIFSLQHPECAFWTSAVVSLCFSSSFSWIFCCLSSLCV